MAYANGANNNFEDVATLSGCGNRIVTRQVKWRTIVSILPAGVITLPLAALLGGMCYYILAAVMNK